MQTVFKNKQIRFFLHVILCRETLTVNKRLSWSSPSKPEMPQEELILPTQGCTFRRTSWNSRILWLKNARPSHRLHRRPDWRLSVICHIAPDRRRLGEGNLWVRPMKLQSCGGVLVQEGTGGGVTLRMGGIKKLPCSCGNRVVCEVNHYRILY